MLFKIYECALRVINQNCMKVESDVCACVCFDSSLLPSGTVSQRSGVLRATAAATWFRSSNTTCAQASHWMVNQLGDE